MMRFFSKKTVWSGVSHSEAENQRPGLWASPRTGITQGEERRGKREEEEEEKKVSTFMKQKYSSLAP